MVKMVAVRQISDSIVQYQEQFLASLSKESRIAARFVEPVAFGFSPQDATEISKLVLAGVKTATGSLLWSYQADGRGRLRPLRRRERTRCRVIHIDSG